MDKVKAVDLFCGVGGTTLGLKRARFNVIAAVECMQEAVEGYKLNHPETKVWADDIRTISPSAMMKTLKLKKGQLDLLAGCPPCQGFSRVRSKSAKEMSKDKRNNLVFEYLRFVKAFHPKTLMLENVPGLGSDKRIQQIEKELTSMGYVIKYKVLDAADYGVPQRRKRFVLVGSRIGEISLAKPSRKRRTVRDAIGSLRENDKEDKLHAVRTEYRKNVLNIIKKIPKDGGLRSDLPKKYQLPCHLRSNGFKDVYGRMKWDDVAPTITGGCTSASKGRFLHPSKNRAITLREAATLQGFPKTYKFPKNASRQVLATLIGNAFPPSFTCAHGKALFHKCFK